jgi:dTDP-4-amino-4,6-dideoxygalactose transaminase
MGIATGVHYWPAVNDQPPFFGSSATALPRARQWSEQEISLPMFAELSEPEVEAVAEALTEVLGELV